MGLRIRLGHVSDSDGVSSASDGISGGTSMGVGLSLGLWGSLESGELLEGILGITGAFAFVLPNPSHSSPLRREADHCETERVGIFDPTICQKVVAF